MLGMLNRNGEPVVTFDPPVGYRYALQAGNQWITMHAMTIYPSREIRPYELSYKVMKR